MNFAEAAREEAKWTRTENGAVALNTSGNALLDLFATIGSLREADESRIETLFEEAYKQDPLFATKIAFYARDIRGDGSGLGERRVFSVIVKYLARKHPNALRPNLFRFGEYGRFDDWYFLIGTPLEDDMWKAMFVQFREDYKNLLEGKPISLLAKWMKTPDLRSRYKELGILTARKMRMSEYVFNRYVRRLRKEIRTVESLMCANQWDEINYSGVPSRAALIYRNAFARHDGERYHAYINEAINGNTKINSSTLFPYNLVGKIYSWHGAIEDSTVEAQWRQLPDYVEKGTNALVIADTSGSMAGRPMHTSIGLAIYFAERNKGAYHNMWMSFSSKPHIHLLKGDTLAQKINSIDKRDWQSNTDLEAAFNLVLDIAIKNNVPSEDMPKSLIVISDMEIDNCGNKNWSFYDRMAAKFGEYGYTIPNIIFWNVNSRHDIFHADSKRKGVQLCSGQSAAVFKQMMSCVGMTPVEAMEKVINSERYELIRIES